MLPARVRGWRRHGGAVLLGAWLLGGCASAPTLPPPDVPWADALFAPPGEVLDASSLFVLDDAMRRFADRYLVTRTADPRRVLLEALYNRHGLQLEYDASRTRTAADAFAERAGNCLSLVVMTAAFAKALGIPVRYQAVVVDAAWSRSGDLQIANGHVNLSLGRRQARSLSVDDHDEMLIDFLPPQDLRGARLRPIDEATVVAMFLNNRAAEALVDGRLDDAYWHARAATHQAPGFVGAYNTLAVVYLRRGLLEQAEQALRTVLTRDDAHTSAMANLVQVLQRQGRDGEAAAWAERLARLETQPPFHFLERGRQALREGDAQAARTWFERELERNPGYHEAHYGLALAHAQLGELEQARAQLALAREHSPTRAARDAYAAKLARLKSAARATTAPL